MTSHHTKHATRHVATWTRTWPTEPGSYWFWGHRSQYYETRGMSVKEMCFVRVNMDSVNGGSLMYSLNGEIIFPPTTGSGAWTAVVFPETPEVTEGGQ